MSQNDSATSSRRYVDEAWDFGFQLHTEPRRSARQYRAWRRQRRRFQQAQQRVLRELQAGDGRDAWGTGR